jgi:Flp pilus assembly protein CpaB
MTYRTRNIAIAVGLALVAMLLTLVYVTSYRHSVQHSQATVHVYVATRDIPAGTSGADVAKSLKDVAVPRHVAVPGAITDPSEVSSLVLSQTLYQGDQVTTKRFTDVTAQGIRGQIKGTMRAVQVPGDANQLLAGTLQAGDRIDLVTSLRPDPSTGVAHSTLALRNLLVLQAPAQSAVAAATGGSATVFAIVAIPDSQVQRLFYVMKNADWTFQLRPALGAKDGNNNVVTSTTIIRGLR